MSWIDDVQETANNAWDSVSDTASNVWNGAIDTANEYLIGDDMADEAKRPATDRKLTPSSQIPDANPTVAAIGVNNDGSTVVQPTTYKNHSGQGRSYLPWVVGGVFVLGIVAVALSKKGGD